jgi:hypothetical protein
VALLELQTIMEQQVFLIQAQAVVVLVLLATETLQ